jgi:hypothetical protein
MADKFGNFYISDIYHVVKANRTIRFLIAIGIIVCIDAIVDVTSIFNGLVQISILKIFGLKIDDMSMYTSIYASIAVLISSNLAIIKKLEYVIGLLIIYVGIFTFVTGYGVQYPHYSLYLTLIVFITMTFPILLWVILEDIENMHNINDKKLKNTAGGIKKHGKGR